MTDHEIPMTLRRTDSSVCTITLNRGQQFNPLSSAMIDALIKDLSDTEQDKNIRVVIIKGSGKGFCAGHDLKEMQANNNRAWMQSMFDRCNQLMLKIIQLPQPVIAQVHGVATAAGCQLVSMCDLAVCASDAKFALPGVNIGLFCSTPAVGVARSIGRKRAMEMLLTGEMMDADTALAWGLVNRVCAPQALESVAHALANQIASKSWPVVALGKQTFYEQIETNIQTAYEVGADAMRRNIQLRDAQCGIEAFIRKQSPTWTHE